MIEGVSSSVGDGLDRAAENYLRPARKFRATHRFRVNAWSILGQDRIFSSDSSPTRVNDREPYLFGPDVQPLKALRRHAVRRTIREPRALTAPPSAAAPRSRTTPRPVIAGLMRSLLDW